VPAFQSTILIFDAHVAFEEAPELQWPEVHAPDAVIDFFKPHVVLGGMAKNLCDLRFAIRRNDGYLSNVWRLWITRPGDVYLGVRSHSGIWKYSFHTSGICRSAFTKEKETPATMKDRAMSKWKRAEAPLPGTGGASRVAWLAFPTDYLSRPIARPTKDIVWIPAAPRSRATFIEVAFTRESTAAVEGALQSRGERVLLKYVALPTAESLIVMHYEGEWENRDLTSPHGAGSVFPEVVFSQDDPLQLGRPVRMCFGPPPNDGDALVLQEIGGHCKNDEAVNSSIET